MPLLHQNLVTIMRKTVQEEDGGGVKRHPQINRVTWSTNASQEVIDKRAYLSM